MFRSTPAPAKKAALEFELLGPNAYPIHTRFSFLFPALEAKQEAGCQITLNHCLVEERKLQ